DLAFKSIDIRNTTISEMSTAIARVAPNARAAGVSVEELFAGLAVLTNAGLSTDKAITSLVSVITKIQKPTKTARDMAKQLGIDFSAARLRAVGLDGVLMYIHAALARNPSMNMNDALRKLFDKHTGR